MRAVNAHHAACLAELDTLYGHLLELLATLDDDALNWSPPVPDTNSVAVLVAHMLGATARWLSRATGHEVSTDRAAEFSSRATRESAVRLVEQAREDAHGWLEAMENVDPATERVVLPGWNVSAAFCVVHALAHAHEHWGQILLTRQLYAARAEAGPKG
jgi:uncharacterized damage-inducible protein DinB